MSKKFAFVFPGQGSQHLGMCREFDSYSPLIKETFSEASEALGYDLWALTQDGPEIKLNQTECTQPALLAAGVAIWRIWQQKTNYKPHFLAGHSLGEYTALVCANAIDFKVAIKLVEQRGKFMQEAVPAGLGSMAAILGLSEEQVITSCKLASEGDKIVSPANYNSIGQIVIAGESSAVEKAMAVAKEKGAKLVKKLPVSVPSHCQMMEPAALRLKEKLLAITIKQPEILVINNVDVECAEDPELIKDALVRQLYNPVRWIETVEFINSQDISLIIESGPGKVLTGLNKRIADNLTAVAIIHPDSFQEALSYIGETVWS